MDALSFPAFVDSLRAPDARLSPQRLSDAMALSIQELADGAGVHRNTVRSHPESAKLQAYLVGMLRAMSAVTEIQPDVNHAVFWFKNQPIRALGHKTAYQLVTEGRTDDVVSYLDSVASGYVG